MRGMKLAFVIILAGTSGAAAAQADAPDEDMRNIVEACVPPDRRAGPVDAPSAAARSAMLSCLARESARLLSGQLPYRVDDITTVRSVAADGPQLTYLNDVEIDAAQVTTAESEALIETTRDYVCSQPVMRAAVSAGSSYRYIWFDRTGAEFNRMTIEGCADDSDEEEDSAALDDELDETPPVTIARYEVVPGAHS